MAMSDLKGRDAHMAPTAAGVRRMYANRSPAAALRHRIGNIFSATLQLWSCCAALVYSATTVSSDTTLPLVMLDDSPTVRVLLNTTVKLLANSETPLVLVLTDSEKAYPDAPDLPRRARLLTPTRFVLERLNSEDSTPDSHVILGHLQLPGSGAAPEDGSPTLTSLAEGRLPSAIIRPETLLLTTADWRLTDSRAIYLRLLAALDQAVVIQNTLQERPSRAGPPASGDNNQIVSNFLYRLSLDWSLITSLQVRLAWVREMHPELADKDANILAWIASPPLAEVSPPAVDPILLQAGKDVP